MNLFNASIDEGATRSAGTLPIEGARSVVYSGKHANLSLELGDVRSLADSTQLITAVATVLAKYSAGDVVALGISKEGVVACVSLQTPGNASLSEVQTQASRLVGDAKWDPQEFQRKVLAAGLSEIANRNPLFGVVVVLDQVAPPRLRQDVSLKLDREGKLEAEYNARVFKSETVHRFLVHVQRTLVVLQEKSSTSVQQTHFLGSEEEAALLRFADGGHPVFRGTMQQLLDDALSAGSQQLAVESGHRMWSLGQLVQRADEIGAAILCRAPSKGARIGIAIEPSFDQIATLIAVVRVGGVIVPLDTTLPPSRQTAIRDLAEIALIVASDDLAGQFGGQNVLALDAVVSVVAVSSDVPTKRVASPDDPLYLMFTSGSTGLPKGVLVAHRTLANLVAAENRRCPTQGKRTLARTSIAFDVGLQEIFATILFGGILVLASGSERIDIGGLPKLIKSRQISRIYLPPVALHQVAEYADGNPIALDDLEEVIVAGEQLHISQAIRRFFRMTTARLINQYGPTETHVATQAIMDAGPLKWPDLPCIGRPLPGVRVYVGDDNLRPVPILVPGEVLVGGIAPALGYVGSTSEGRDRFVLGPAEGCSGNVVYRTGDRARWLSDGTLEFLGRRDDQVKIRGYRVELGDLEAHAQHLPGVRLAAAKYWTSEAWTGLALYMVLNDLSRSSIRELRQALREKLPEYMVPALGAMMLLRELPLTASGKVDRAKLRHPGALSEEDKQSSSTADRVKEMWRRRLGLSDISADDDFLDIGGHSLLAIQIVSEVNDRFGIAVPLSALLRGISLRDFTDLVEQQVAFRSGGATIGETPNVEKEGAVGKTTSGTAWIELGGQRLVVVSEAEARHLWAEVYGQHAYRHHALRYDTGSTIMDVGANIGLFSRYAVQETGGCRIIAVEPAHELFDCLCQNLAKLDTPCDLLEIGCGDEDLDAAAFWYFPQVPSMSSFAPNRANDRTLLRDLLMNAAARDAPSETLDDRALDAAFEGKQTNRRRRRISSILRDLHVGKVDLLKIDVQHGELEVMRGVERDDWARICQIVIELRDRDGRLESTANFLRDVGFTVGVRSIDLHRGTDIRYVCGWRS